MASDTSSKKAFALGGGNRSISLSKLRSFRGRLLHITQDDISMSAHCRTSSIDA